MVLVVTVVEFQLIGRATKRGGMKVRAKMHPKDSILESFQWAVSAERR